MVTEGLAGLEDTSRVASAEAKALPVDFVLKYKSVPGVKSILEFVPLIAADMEELTEYSSDEEIVSLVFSFK